MTVRSTRTRRATSALLLALCGTTLSGLSASAQATRSDTATSLTIYSTATPGAVSPMLYRPVPDSLQQFSSAIYRGYSQGIPGYAVVRHDRTITLGEGRTVITFADVAALLDPTTVTFTSLSAPNDTRVIEQNYQFDLISAQKMLERFTGQAVVLDGKEVTLLSASAAGGVLVKDADGSVRWQNGYGAISFPNVADGLITKPTLIWDIATTKPGEHQTRVAYQTEGITWWADYNITFHEGKDGTGTLDLSAWVSILNQSGATYENATLKLIAGDVHRAPPPSQPSYSRGVAREMLAMADASGFEEKSFFEYHLYTLGRPTTIPHASTKQIELFDAARNVPAEKVLVYYGMDPGWRPYWSEPAIDRNIGVPTNTKVDVYLTFKNDKESGMGVPLPSGRIRVSKLDDADGSLEFIGEDVIDHTPRNETILLKLGNSFDVVGERTQTDFKIDRGAKWMEETVQIKLRNRKEEPVKVIVRESLYRWTNWEIIESTHQHEKQDARTIHMPITLKPDEEGIVTYKVRYTW